MNQINEIIAFENGGQIIIGELIVKTESDFNQLIQCCTYFAKQGSFCEILPKIHFKDPLYKYYFGDLIGTKYENKCPDFKVDGKFYEFESFVGETNRNKLSKMFTRGLKQSNRVIITYDGSTINHLQRMIFLRKLEGQKIDEVWILEINGELTRVL